MSLLGCSTEVLNEILALLQRSELIGLCISSKTLYYILTNRATYSHWSQHLNRNQWVSPLLYQLHKLKEVSLSFHGRTSTSFAAIPAPRPLAFNRHLQTLKITGSNALWVFLQPNSNSSAPRPDLPWIDLSSLLPQLQTLEIRDNCELSHNVALPETLPVSLTSLRVQTLRHSFGRFTMPFIGSLVSLTSLYIFPLELETKLIDEFDARLAKLTSLTSLRLNHLPVSYAIPSGLIRFNGGDLSDERLVQLANCPSLSLYDTRLKNPALLSPRLTALNIGIDIPFVDFLKALPRTLLKLRVNRSLQFFIPPEELAYLPESLTSLRLHGGLSVTTIHAMKAILEDLKEKGEINGLWLPPNLTRLDVSFSRGLEREWWPLIPSSLRMGWLSLEIPSSPSEPPFPSFDSTNLRKMLPDYMGSLYLSSNWDNAPNWTDWSFPIGIKSLFLFFRQFSDNYAEPSPSQVIFNLSKDRWPLHLHTLSLGWSFFPRLLPSLLRLPDSLRNLTLEDRNTPLHPLATDELVASFANLPTRLQHLTIDIKPRIMDPSALLIHLPATLTNFECLVLYNFDDKCISHLPPKLERLVVRHAQNVSDAGVAMLPKVLEILELQLNRDITPEALRIFPLSLVSLILPKNVNFKNGMKRDIIQILEGRKMTVSIHTKKLTI